MNVITLSEDALRVEMTGWSKIWALRKSLHIPFACIEAVTLRPRDLQPAWLKIPGTYLPGVIAAGTYRARGRTEFWSTRFKPHCLVLELVDHEFTRVVLDHPKAGELLKEPERKKRERTAG